MAGYKLQGQILQQQGLDITAKVVMKRLQKNSRNEN